MKKSQLIFIIVIAAVLISSCRSKPTRDNLTILPEYPQQNNEQYDSSTICLVKKMKTPPAEIISDEDRGIATGILSFPLGANSGFFSTPENQSLFNCTKMIPSNLIQKLIEEKLTILGYKVLLPNTTTPAKELMKVQRVLEPLFVLQRSIKLKDEYASDLLLVLEIRKPLSVNAPKDAEDKSLFFQTWSRSFIKEPVKGKTDTFDENCKKAVDNLFKNPKFRKALEP